jgi:hypothetical protein
VKLADGVAAATDDRIGLMRHALLYARHPRFSLPSFVKAGL